MCVWRYSTPSPTARCNWRRVQNELYADSYQWMLPSPELWDRLRRLPLPLPLPWRDANTLSRRRNRCRVASSGCATCGAHMWKRCALTMMNRYIWFSDLMRVIEGKDLYALPIYRVWFRNVVKITCHKWSHSVNLRKHSCPGPLQRWREICIVSTLSIGLCIEMDTTIQYKY